MKLNVPEMLKVLLVDDWEAVTKNAQVCVTIPNPRSDTSHILLVVGEASSGADGGRIA